MRVAAALVILAGAVVLYVQLHGNGKGAALPGYKQSQYQSSGPNTYQPDTKRLSAQQLERLLDAETLHWAPAPQHLVHMRCEKRRKSSWDYICRDAYLQLTFGVDVDSVGVTNFHLLRNARA
jgi:hypothetical protein